MLSNINIAERRRAVTESNGPLLCANQGGRNKNVVHGSSSREYTIFVRMRKCCAVLTVEVTNLQCKHCELSSCSSRAPRIRNIEV